MNVLYIMTAVIWWCVFNLSYAHAGRTHYALEAYYC